MSSNEQKPLTDLSFDVILKFTDMQTSVRMSKSIKQYRPIHQKKWPMFKKVEFRIVEEVVGEGFRQVRNQTDRISCDMDGQKFIQLEGQSDEDYFRIIQEKVLKKEHRILELVVNPSMVGWYHRLPVFSELPMVKHFKFFGLWWGPRGAICRFFEGLSAREAFCTTGDPIVLNLDPIKNARYLTIESIIANYRIMPALQACNATHWNVTAHITTVYDDFWVFEKFASGVMEIGSFYKITRNGSCGLLIRHILLKYPETVRSEEKQEQGKQNYFLNLPNGSKLVTTVIEKRKRVMPLPSFALDNQPVQQPIVEPETYMKRELHLKIVGI